jgi:hypothetical protein
MGNIVGMVKGDVGGKGTRREAAGEVRHDGVG